MFQDLFPTMAQTYGVEIQPPGKPNTQIYKRYVLAIESSQALQMYSDGTK